MQYKSFLNRTGKKSWIICIGICSFLATAALGQYQLPDREIHYRPGDWVSYPMMRYIHSITMDYRVVYFGTTNGIDRYDFLENRWETPMTVSDGLENGNALLVFFDFVTGFLWCATETGLNYYNSSSRQWQNVLYQEIGSEPITSIGRGKNYLWIEALGVFAKDISNAGNFLTASSEEATKDEVEWNGNLAKKDRKILPQLFMKNGYLFNPEGYIQDKALRQFQITGTFQDQFDRLWIATWGLGAGVADTRSDRLELLPFGIFSSKVDAMAWDDEGMWIGGIHTVDEPGGITRWKEKEDEWDYFEAQIVSRLRSDDVTSIAVDTSSVWFGTTDGLVWYNKQEDSWRFFSGFDNLWDNQIHSVVLGDSVLWVGTDLGINRVLLPEIVIVRETDERLVRRPIYRLEMDGEDVWAGTDRGIFHYVQQKKIWETFTGAPNMLIKAATAISIWRDEIWFGTQDGVEVYDKKRNEWKGFPSILYPTGGSINAILADSGAVWIASDDGVLKYNKSEDRWRRFTTDDGLLDDSVRWMLLDGDYIWFGTGRGLTRFYWNAPHRID